MGGQGVYPIPNINPGWVEMLDLTWNLTHDQRDPVTSFNQLQNQPIQTSNNDDSTNNEVNSQSMQHQQDQLKPLTIEEKISQVQQQSVSKAMDPNVANAPIDPVTSPLTNYRINQYRQVIMTILPTTKLTVSQCNINKTNSNL